MTARTEAERRTCPACGMPGARPIVYGLPSPDLFEDPEGELGGCMITPDDPAFRCRNLDCGHAFGRSPR